MRPHTEFVIALFDNNHNHATINHTTTNNSNNNNDNNLNSQTKEVKAVEWRAKSQQVICTLLVLKTIPQVVATGNPLLL